MVRVTVQGGIGTAAESELLEKEYRVDGTGWGSPFLLVPDVVNIPEDHLRKIISAGENDVHLSEASPLGIPFLVSEEFVQRGTPDLPDRKGQAGQRLPQGLPGLEHRIHEGAHLHRQPGLPAPQAVFARGQPRHAGSAPVPRRGNHRQGVHLS